MTHTATRDELVGRSLGEFVLRERIGEGGFGAVYRAIQPQLERDAVVKVLHARLHQAPAATERFLREAKLASKLDHPYAAHVYAFGVEADGEHWIAMEFVRGTPLDQLVRENGPLTLDRLVPLLDRICEVVHTAHEQGIVHRDIKPANVMVLSRAGRLLPKLLDFGIAKGLDARADEAVPQITLSTPPPDMSAGAISAEMIAADVTLEAAGTPAPTPQPRALGTPPPITGAGSVDLTQQGAIMGSPLYMAPEQWLDAGEVDARADLYALGVLAYECLTGKPPLGGRTVQQIAQAHARQSVPRLSVEFPPALDAVFAKVLAKRANDRYPDALAFAAAFRQASGIASEPPPLPDLDPAVRDATLHGAPLPIAEAVAAYEAARNLHQARDTVAMTARTIIRYLGLLAIASRSRVSRGTAGLEQLRLLSRRQLEEREWLDLGRALTREWLDSRDAHPIPELVGALHDDAIVADLEALAALRDAEATSEDALATVLDDAVARLGRLLVRLAFVRDYTLCVMTGEGRADRWMGTRRTKLPSISVYGRPLEPGTPALLDRNRVPVLSLAPLFQVHPPAPGAPDEVFLFDGRGRRGAKLVALPSGFEAHDDTLWDWFRAQLGTLEDDRTTLDDSAPPYRGLAAFGAADGAMFFGRETQVDAFVNRMKLSPLLAVVGRSGAGKSSFVHAGVIPALPAGTSAIVMRPGGSPFAALAARLEHSGIPADRAVLLRDRDALGGFLRNESVRRGPIVLVVDQLEELFTLCQHETERRAFADAVVAAARSPEDKVRVIFTLRDDFLVRAEQLPPLRNRLGQALQLLTVPAEDDLLRILVEPARRVGYEFEAPELPREMVAEVADQPGALALISFTAAKLWELRDRHFKQLTRSAYKTLGGVGGALANHAEQTLDAMPTEERALTREAFRHLVTSQNTRAVLARNELRELLGNDERADGVIEKLIAARLLVASENETGAETIEIIHEALLVAWPRLVDWGREDSEGARFREQLRTAAKQWDERGRPRGLVWRDDAFAELTRWRARQTGPLTGLESAFADASEREASRRRRQRSMLVALGFNALGVIVVVLMVSRSRISAEKRVAVTANAELHDNLQRQWEAEGRLLVLEGDPMKALAALAHAGELGAHGRAHDFLLAEAIAATDGALHTLPQDGPVRAPQFSHDGMRVITGTVTGKARIWNASTGAKELELVHQGVVARTTFSPDDATVMTASTDGTARWWNARTGEQLRRIDHGKYVWCAMFSPDGKLGLSAGQDDQIVVWDLATRADRLKLHGEGAGFTACAFSADGTMFAAGDAAGVVRMWRTATGELVHRHADQNQPVVAIAFFPDGARLVAASYDHSAVIWSTASGHLEHRLEHADALYSVEPSPDGKHVLTGSNDRTAAVWDTATGARVFVLAGHTGGIMRAVFSPDGSHIITASEDSTTRLWDAASGRSLATWFHDDSVFDVALDPRGERAVTASNDGTAVIWAVRRQSQAVAVRAPSGTSAARLSPDGAQVALGNRDGSVRIYDTRSGGLLAEVGDADHGVVEDVAFDASGRYLATANNRASVRIWDTRAPKAPPRVLAAHIESTADINQLDWSGTQIVTGSDDGYLRLWNAETGALQTEKLAAGGTGVTGVSFDTAHHAIMAVTYDGVVQTWSLAGELVNSEQDPAKPWRAVLDPSGARVLALGSSRASEIRNLDRRGGTIQLFGHLGHVTDAAWSPDGQIVATAALDGTVRFWDAATGDPLQILPSPGHLSWVDFAPDGRFLAAEDDGYAIIGELPAFSGGTAALQRLLRCRVPYEVVNERLQLRARGDRSACDQ